MGLKGAVYNEKRLNLMNYRPSRLLYFMSHIQYCGNHYILEYSKYFVLNREGHQ